MFTKKNKIKKFIAKVTFSEKLNKKIDSNTKDTQGFLGQLKYSQYNWEHELVKTGSKYTLFIYVNAKNASSLDHFEIEVQRQILRLFFDSNFIVQVNEGFKQTSLG